MRIIRTALLAIALATVVSCDSPEPLHERVANYKEPLTGRAAYMKACGSCHEEGLGEAPATGDTEAWAERSPLWMAVLSEHAKEGYLEMPAKGGDDSLSEAELEYATDYMLSLTYPERKKDQ